MRAMSRTLKGGEQTAQKSEIAAKDACLETVHFWLRAERIRTLALIVHLPEQNT